MRSSRSVAGCALLVTVVVACAAPPARTPSAGPPAAIVAKDAGGRDIDLAAPRGRVVLVDFFATWCESCREWLPFCVALERRYAGAVDVIAVSLDEDDAALRAFLAEERPSVRVLRDPGATAAEAAGVRALPTLLVIGRDGRVVARLEPAWPSDRERVEALVEAAAGR